YETETPQRFRHGYATIATLRRTDEASASRCAHDLSDGQRKMRPVGGFGGELLPPRASQRVKTRSTIVLRHAPVAFDPAAPLDPIERWVQGAFFNAQQIVCELLDPLADPIP